MSNINQLNSKQQIVGQPNTTGSISGPTPAPAPAFPPLNNASIASVKKVAEGKKEKAVPSNQSKTNLSLNLDRGTQSAPTLTGNAAGIPAQPSASVLNTNHPRQAGGTVNTSNSSPDAIKSINGLNSVKAPGAPPTSPNPTMNAPSSQKGDVKQALEIINLVPKPDTDRNAQEIADILKDAAKDGVQEALQHGPQAGGLDAAKGFAKGLTEWMGKKLILDLKQNQLMPKLLGNFEAGLRDGFADLSGVPHAPHASREFNPDGGIYKAAYRVAGDLSQKMPASDLANLRKVMQDPQQRREFDAQVRDKINNDLSLRTDVFFPEH